MLRLEKFSKKSVHAFSSWNRTWEGVESTGKEKKDAPERKGFRDGVDLRLGAMRRLTK